MMQWHILRELRSSKHQRDQAVKDLRAYYQKVSNAWKSEFIYDGLMRRRVRKEFTWSSGTWLQTNEVRYIYDGRLVLQERFYVPAGSTLIPQNTVTYTHGNDLSGSLQGAGGIGGLLARSEISNLRSPHAYYSCDGNGNITALIDTNQVLVAQYHFDPYGKIPGMAGPMAEANLYRFSSKEMHPNSGLVYYLYRYFEPSLQRWINRDPIEERGGINLARFGGGDPVNRLDAFGLDQFGCTIEGDIALINLGIDVSISLVIDTENPGNSGFYTSFGPSQGLTLGAGVGLIYAPETVVGHSVNMDANIAAISPTISFDPITASPCAVAGTWGPGLGASASETDTDPLITWRDIVDWFSKIIPTWVPRPR